MRKFILSILILLSLTSTVYSAQLNGNQLREDYATKAYVNGTIENNVYTKAQTNATIEAAIANATAEISTNKTVTVTAGENLSVGDVVSLINNYGTVTAVKNNLTVNSQPNGAESVFNAAGSIYISACAIDTTRFIVINGKDAGDSNYPKATVGTVNGSTISWGTESAAFENYAGGWTSVCKIGTDKILAIYSANGKGKAVVLSISGTTITVNTPYEYLASQPEYNSVTTLENDKALLTCRKADVSPYAGIAFVLSVSGTTVSGAATETAFNAAATAYISVSALSSTEAIVAYQDGGNSSYGTAQVLSISGTSITPNTEYVIKNANCVYIQCVSTSATKAVVIYSNVSDSFKGYANVLGISGTEVSVGADNNFDDIGNRSSIVKISDANVLVAYSDISYNGKSRVGTIGSTTISFGSASTFNAASTTYLSTCYLGNNKLVITYKDTGNSDYGTAVVNTWVNTDYSSVRGISTTTTTSGSDAVILLNGTATMSGLTTGSQYYLASDYSLSTSPVSLSIMKNSSAQTGEIYIGTAKSTTEIYIDVDYR